MAITKLEEEYLNKINKIWDREGLLFVDKIKMSMKVVDDIDKIKWPKRVPANLLELTKTVLKSTLLRAIGGNIRKVLLSSGETPKQSFQQSSLKERLFWKLRN